jgi:hypothetical protein
MGEEATPLERLLIERVALGWLETNYLGLPEAQACNLTERQKAELRRRQDRASSRRLAAAPRPRRGRRRGFGG